MACRWPVYRNGREEPCGRRGGDVGRCRQHQDRRPVRERALDPLGPYVAAVEKIHRARMKALKSLPEPTDT